MGSLGARETWPFSFDFITDKWHIDSSFDEHHDSIQFAASPGEPFACRGVLKAAGGWRRYSVNLGVLAYIPPKSIGHPEAFMENLRQFPTKHPLILYSDQPWPGVTEKIFNPEQARINGQIHAISNLVFLQAVRIAIARGLTHFLYIECDSRVGKKHWDNLVFDEFFSGPKAEVGGTLLCCHGHDSPQFKSACDNLLAQHRSCGDFPIKDFAPMRSSWGKLVPVVEPSCVFAMGSLSVMSVEFMREIWGACDLLSTSKMLRPWDKEIGIRAFTRLGMDAFGKFKHLSSIYSSYGNKVRTEGQRVEMLESGKVVAVHQIKSSWVPSKQVPNLSSKPAAAVRVSNSPITVVITNFKRPDMVWRAFQSCVSAGIQNIVISSSGCDDTLSKVHSRIKTWMPSVVVDAIPGDLGCNEMWLRGVKKAKTPWVHILHDDDILLPDFRKVESGIRPEVGFVHWCGEIRNVSSGLSRGIINILPNIKEGVAKSDPLLKFLMRPGTYAISPILGLFKKDDLIETLTECQGIKDGFELRPNMMIGNDTLIWMRAAEKHMRFFWMPKVLVNFGSWAGSVTDDDVTNKRGKLVPIYDRMREYFISHPKYRFKPPKGIEPKTGNSKIIHCVELHEEADPMTQSRQEIARASWNQLYQMGVVPAHYQESQYVRDSTMIGDDRKLVFVKDMLAVGMSIANDNDIIMWTNGDNILHPKLPAALAGLMKNQPVIVAQRCGYRSPVIDFTPNAPLFRHDGNPGGRDLFAFRKWWLDEYWNEIPDYILGGPWWDVLMTLMIRKYLGVQNLSLFNGIREKELPLGYVAHIDHQSTWLKLMRNGSSISNDYDTDLARHHLLSIRPDKTLEEIGS